MKKIIVSDYDQTFYINDEDIEINKKMVDKFMNLDNLFVIATGRSYFDFHNKLDIYKFNYNYAVLNHGATIIDCENNILLNISIPNEIILNIKNDLDLEKSVSYFCCSGIESRVDFGHEDLTKINIKYETQDFASKKIEDINTKYKDYVTAYYVNNNSIEIISKDINKEKAILYLVGLNNVNEENVYTIGDGYSDIGMVKKFNGCCMKKSIREIKEYSIKEYSSVSNMIEDVLDNKI